MLKLLVTDLDGTLLKIGNELSAGISDENREALTEFVREGGHVAIASSRGPDAQTMISGLLGVSVAAIGMNGFIVLDEEGEKISEHWMDFADFAELVEFIQKHQINGSLITRGDDNGAYGYGGEETYPQLLNARPVRQSARIGVWNSPISLTGQGAAQKSVCLWNLASTAKLHGSCTRSLTAGLRSRPPMWICWT